MLLVLGHVVLFDKILEKIGIKATSARDDELSDAELTEQIRLCRQQGQDSRALKLMLLISERHYNRDELDQAEQRYQEALKIAREINDSEKMSTILMNLGSFAAGRKMPEKAQEYYKEALSIARRSGDQDNVCSLLTNLGLLAHKQGDLDTARTYLKEGWIVAHHSGNFQVIEFLKAKRHELPLEFGSAS